MSQNMVSEQVKLRKKIANFDQRSEKNTEEDS